MIEQHLNYLPIFIIIIGVEDDSEIIFSVHSLSHHRSYTYTIYINNY